MTLIRLENDTILLFFFLGIVALILVLSILRRAVRINVRTQRMIIYFMKHQFIKSGATPEELNAIEKGIEHIMND